MSIFKEPLKAEVKAQLKARQDAIGARTPDAIKYFNSRTAWIRMTSAVNIAGDGGATAKQNVLLGGVLYNKSPRAGVGENASHAYSLYTPSGAKHRLGIRPMPGITGIDIISKSAYGSLREVTVKFNCWDIRQLEDLELLYMRQGFTALVEWGWINHLDNAGKLQGGVTFIEDVLNGGTKKEDIWKKIWDKSLSSEGNYEGIYGTIKNYSWSARPDGGYDCSTTIITMGEIVESLKVNYARSDTKVAEEGLFNIIDKDLLQPDKPVNKSYSQCFLAGMVDEIYRSIYPNYIAKSTTNVSLTTSKGSVACDFFMLDVEKSDDSSSSESDDASKEDFFGQNKEQIYIRLKDFIALFNVNVTLQDESGQSPIVAVSVTEGFHQSKPDKDLLCLGNDYQISTDPTVCQIGNPLYENPKVIFGEDEDIIGDLQNATDIVKALTANTYYDKDTTFGTIGNIYVNLAYIYGLVVNDDLASQDKNEKKEISVYDFFKNMMSGISTAIGNVANFDIHVDPTDSIARIIDINYVNDEKQKDAYANAFPLEIHSLSSTIRSYKFESQIFPEMSATVAIGAQVKGGAIGTGNNTLVDFNKGLEDRIIPKKTAPNIQTNPKDDKEKTENLKTSMKTIAKYFSNLEKSGGFWGFFEDGGFNINEVSSYAGALRDIIVYYQTTAADNSNNRSIIPTKFSCEMDGIGGLIIGNIFKLPSDLSPKGYRGDTVGVKIGYVVTGLGHSVQNNDWITKIDAQYIILDEPKGLPPEEVRKIISRKLKTTTVDDGGSGGTDKNKNKIKSKYPAPPSSKVIQKNMDSIEKACRKQGITNDFFIIALKAKILCETGGVPINEDLAGWGYTIASRHREFFGARVKVFLNGISDNQTPISAGIWPGAEAFAEIVYGPPAEKIKRLGLGNTNKGDAYKYRGRSYIGITGKAQYIKYTNELGVDFIKNPDLMNYPDNAAATTVSFIRSAFLYQSSQYTRYLGYKVDSKNPQFKSQEDANLFAMACIGGSSLIKRPPSSLAYQEILNKVDSYSADITAHPEKYRL